MRLPVLLLLCLTSSCLAEQAMMGQSPTSEHAIEKALLGDWAGYLEYRDYSEPATSTKRVQLPTWLSVTQAPQGLMLHYIYDDGPNKVVEEREGIAFDIAHRSYTSASLGHTPDTYQVDGFEALKDGRGTLVLLGTGTDNDRPAEHKITLTIRRNIVEWLLEARPKGSSEPFAFRHLYRLTRAQVPAVTGGR